MEPWTMFVDFVLIAGISLLGLSIIFLAKSKGSGSQKMLIVFFANAIFFLLYYYAFLHKSRMLGGIAVFFGHGVGFLLGPMLLFQLKSLILPKEKFIKSLCLNLVPFSLVWLFFSVPLAVSMVSPYFQEFGRWYARHDYIVNIPENIFFMVYVVLAFKLLSQIKRATRENSATEKNNLSWYKHLLIGFALIIVLDTLCTVYELFFPMIPWNIGTFIAFCLVLMYSYLGYKGMFQAHILIPDFLLQKMAITTPEEPQAGMPEEIAAPKQPVRALDHYTGEEIEKLKQTLYDILENKKLYRKESLSLAELSEEMGISTKKLSELLNQHLDTSFYNIINQYRVAEVIDRMAIPDSDKYTLVGIAYECGFQSKASFNRIFKQRTGKSPSDYRKSLQPTVQFAKE